MENYYDYYSKSNMMIVSFLFLMFHLGLSQQLLDPSLSLGNMQCVEKLGPCEPYLKSPGAKSGTPPETCCQPLKDMIAKDLECLCNVFNSPEMLQSINATRDDALKLPKACGLDDDASKCNKDASSSTSSPSGLNLTAADTEEKASNSASSITVITPYGLVLMFASVFSAHCWV
ncbi:non-specific lipid transfer protein GPI-anchored 9-like [Prosopis cineraria]|uniref:non-specific lipid transfer protein GPI-anchored 9-like n=1 Tax=Prosopis cineraria TaxID=364024 RepID=UPI00240EBEAB|nr:non-specific lipid transfer protein GPI-anchored 9-like [Prosopis cineraria]